MTIEARVIADSIGEYAPRITTFELKYPRFIHAEFMTHRLFSRNASSSRAIPVERQIQAILEDTAMPVHWGKNQSGMQAREENDALVGGEGVTGYNSFDNEFAMIDSREAWLRARDSAIRFARAFDKAGYHKQIVNRFLEPFSHIKVVCTATNYSNFFHLRRHPDAQPEIKVLADCMWDAMEASTPEVLREGQWHLPYITSEEMHKTRLYAGESLDPLLMVSVARCARVSYKTHEGKPTTMAEDITLYKRLVGSDPLHASPAEHQARVAGLLVHAKPLVFHDAHLSGNFDPGWVQYRKMLPGECY